MNDLPSYSPDRDLDPPRPPQFFCHTLLSPLLSSIIPRLRNRKGTPPPSQTPTSKCCAHLPCSFLHHSLLPTRHCAFNPKFLPFLRSAVKPAACLKRVAGQNERTAKDVAQWHHTSWQAQAPEFDLHLPKNKKPREQKCATSLWPVTCPGKVPSPPLSSQNGCSRLAQPWVPCPAQRELGRIICPHGRWEPGHVSGGIKDLYPGFYKVWF